MVTAGWKKITVELFISVEYNLECWICGYLWRAPAESEVKKTSPQFNRWIWKTESSLLRVFDISRSPTTKQKQQLWSPWFSSLPSPVFCRLLPPFLFLQPWRYRENGLPRSGSRHGITYFSCFCCLPQTAVWKERHHALPAINIQSPPKEWK